MKQQIAAAIVAASMVGGVGTGVVAHQLRSDDPKDDAHRDPVDHCRRSRHPKRPSRHRSRRPRRRCQPALQPVSVAEDLRRQVGPVKVGMTKTQAFATGYLDKDVRADSCDTVDQLVWKDAYKETLDIYTLDDGAGVVDRCPAARPVDASGLQVGSTFKAVKAVLGQERLPDEVGYGQTGMMVNEGDGWIGFLFDAAPDAMTDATQVSFIEVTRGNPPDLMRDGC